MPDSRLIYGASEITSFYKDDERSIEEKYGKIIAPYFKIEISDKDDTMLYSASSLVEGNSWDLDGLIVNNVEFEESIDSSNLIKLTINNPTVELASSNLFAEGNNIDLFLGYDGRRSYFMGRGIIVEISPKYSGDDISKIELVCYDISHFMMEEGRAEIIPEGSEWWLRREASTAEGPVSEVSYNNSTPDTELDEVDAAQAERINRAASEQQETPVFVERTPLNNVLDAGGGHTTRVIEGGTVRIDNRVNIHDRQRQRQLRTSNSWRRQTFSRRKKKAGKVWKNKTDAQIAAAIFQSYGVIPYVEATNERVVTDSQRLRRQRLLRDQERIERTREDPFLDSAIDDLEIERRINREIRPDEDYDQAAARINREFSQEQQELGLQDYNPNRSDELHTAQSLSRDTREADIVGSNENFNGINRDPNSRNMVFFDNPEIVNDVNENTGVITRGSNEGALVEQDYQFADDNRFRVAAYRGAIPDNLNIPELDDRKVTQKAGTSDWEFLLKLAEGHGFILFVFFDITSRRWIGYWGPERNVPQFRQFIFRYNAGDNTTLGNVNPNLSTRNQSNEINLLYYDPVSRRENRLRVAIDNASERYSNFHTYGPEAREDIIGEGPEVTLVIHGQRVRVNANRRFRSAEDARRWLVGFWIQHANDFITIDGDTIVGIPEIRGREKHVFQGVERFSGEYFLTQVRHTLSPGSGYKTSFVGRKVVSYQNESTDSDLLVVDQSEVATTGIDEESTDVVV